MNGFLFDANIPSRIRFEPSLPVISSSMIGSNPTDTEVWEFARRNELVILSKDADFSDRIVINSPPPWVVHLRFGNLRRSEFHRVLAKHWRQIEALLKTHKLVNLYIDRVEGIH
jgi:predicted nuclease of predicted toxin-antitoxin system